LFSLSLSLSLSLFSSCKISNEDEELNLQNEERRGEERCVKSSPAQEGPEIHTRKKHGMRK